MTPDFNAALQAHFDCIRDRDLDAFKDHLTKSGTLYTVVQNGHAFRTRDEAIALHEEWFKSSAWSWEGSLVHKVVGSDMAMALVKYDYRPTPDSPALENWLTYVFRLEDGAWRIVHDQNTALDYPAFARANGIPL
jgi:ketosteroid isomerase-like protein